MNEAERTDLAQRIVQTFWNTPPAHEWEDALRRHCTDAPAARRAFIKLRDTSAKRELMIHSFISEYRHQVAAAEKANAAPVGPCSLCDDGAVTYWLPSDRGGHNRFAARCSCRLGTENYPSLPAVPRDLPSHVFTHPDDRPADPFAKPVDGRNGVGGHYDSGQPDNELQEAF